MQTALEDYNDAQAAASSFMRPKVCTAIATGVRRDGSSVLARVEHFTPRICIVHKKNVKLTDDQIRTMCEKTDQFLDAPFGSTSAERKSAYRLYGWHYEDSDPTKRKLWMFVDVMAPCADPASIGRELQRLFKREGWVGLEVHEHSLGPDFSFYECIGSAPNKWVRAEHVRRSASRISVRDDEFEVDIRNIKAVRDESGDEPRDLPPQLIVYADLECAAHKPGAFPYPNDERTRITAYGMSFAWTISIPPSKRNVEGPSEEQKQLHEQELATVRAEVEVETEERIRSRYIARVKRRETRAKRKVERSERRQRVSEYMRRSDPSLASDLDSASESEGSGAEESSIRADATKRIAARAAESAARLGGAPWRGGDDRGLCPGQPFLRVVFINAAGFDMEDASRPACVPPSRVQWVADRRVWLVWMPSEADMLEAARVLATIHMDVDGWRWYNGLGFDLPCILARSAAHAQCAGAMYHRALCIPPRVVRKSDTQSVSMMDVNCVDIMLFVREMFAASMEGTRLENFCERFGVPGKDAIEKTEITRCFLEKDWDTTIKMATYCSQDCDALLRAVTASGAETTIAEFARLVAMNSDIMWTSGQSMRYVYLVARQAHALGFVMDWINQTLDTFGPMFGIDPAKERNKQKKTTDKKGYKGATVLEPKVGFRGKYPMCTGDFQSLYPSIMRGIGICFSTLVLGGIQEVRILDAYDVPMMRVQISDEGDPDVSYWFVCPQALVHQEIGGEACLFDQRWAALPSLAAEGRRRHHPALDGEGVQPSVWAQNVETWDDAQTGARFARSSRLVQTYAQPQRCVLPALEEVLFNMRAAVKKQMGGVSKSSIEYSVLNTRQDAIKRMMNSIYGGTGLKNGPYMCVPVAASITSTGRSLILFSKNFVESYPFHKLVTWRKHHTPATDWITEEFHPDRHTPDVAAELAHPSLQRPCEVIYGDTDSIMFVLYIPDAYLADDMIKGCYAKSVADFLLERLNESFPRPITIVNEQIAFRFFLKGKKMYANMYKENPKALKMSQKVKGLDMVRRDRCEIAKRTQERCVNRVLTHPDGVQAALRTAKRAVFAVLDRALPLSDYVITKELKKVSASPQEHVCAAYAMNRRSPGTYNFGKYDRVPYVITTRSDPARMDVPPTFLQGASAFADDDDDDDEDDDDDHDDDRQQPPAAAQRSFFGTKVPAVAQKAAARKTKVAERSRCIGDPDATTENVDTQYYIDVLKTPLQMFFQEDADALASIQRAFSFAQERVKRPHAGHVMDLAVAFKRAKQS